LVDSAIPSPSREEVEQAILDYAPALLELGVTGVHDPGELVDNPESLPLPLLLRDMAEGGRLPLRVTESIREGQLRRAVGWGMKTGHALGRYRDGWLKLFSDGSLGSRSAALLEPYEADDPAGPPVGGPRGMPLRTPAQLAASATEATDAGIAVQIHAIGDAAVRIALDVLAGLPTPGGGAMHRIEHAQLVDPQDVPRFAQLGIAASVQPCHLCSDATAETLAWGPRTAHSFPLRDLDAAGAVMPFGTDAPVEPPDPWRGIAAAVARRDSTWAAERGAFHPEQSIPVWRAIRAACLDPARSVGAADEGRLSAGYRADFIVVPSEGLLTDDPTGAALAAIHPRATVLDGEMVYRSAGFDPG
jgi:predicted amidohydrolase YtcJ